MLVSKLGRSLDLFHECIHYRGRSRHGHLFQETFLCRCQVTLDGPKLDVFLDCRNFHEGVTGQPQRLCQGPKVRVGQNVDHNPEFLWRQLARVPDFVVGVDKGVEVRVLVFAESKHTLHEFFLVGEAHRVAEIHKTKHPVFLVVERVVELQVVVDVSGFPQRPEVQHQVDAHPGNPLQPRLGWELVTEQHPWRDLVLDLVPFTIFCHHFGLELGLGRHQVCVGEFDKLVLGQLHGQSLVAFVLDRRVGTRRPDRQRTFVAHVDCVPYVLESLNLFLFVFSRLHLGYVLREFEVLLLQPSKVSKHEPKFATITGQWDCFRCPTGIQFMDLYDRFGQGRLDPFWLGSEVRVVHSFFLFQIRPGRDRHDICSRCTNWSALCLVLHAWPGKDLGYCHNLEPTTSYMVVFRDVLTSRHDDILCWYNAQKSKCVWCLFLVYIKKNIQKKIPAQTYQGVILNEKIIF